MACWNARLKPIHDLFWENLPLTNIFLLIMPNILHQMLQGVIKHLIQWLISIFGPRKINAWCHTIPPNHKILLFTKGISLLSQVSGHEHKKMCYILLELVADLLIPGGWNLLCLVKAIRSLLDFLFLAQYPCHTTDTILQLQASFFTFHENKQVFINLRVWEHFNIPKFHSLTYYVSSI